MRKSSLPAAQDNNNIRAAKWAGHQWNAEWTYNPKRLRIFIPDTGTPRSDPSKNWCRAFPFLVVQMGYGLLCGL